MEQKDVIEEDEEDKRENLIWVGMGIQMIR